MLRLISGRCLAALLLLMFLGLAAGQAAGEAAAAATRVYDPPRGEQRFVVLADFNGPYGSLTYPAPLAGVMVAITEVWQPDLLLSPGDVIAGQSRELSAERLAAMWRAFDRFVAAPLRAAGLPYAFAMGNHDASSLTAHGERLFKLDQAAAANYWGQEMYAANLAYVDRADFPFNYTFRHGGVFIAVIDASSATVSDAQRTWLATTLATPAARTAQLRLVVGHLPLVAVGEGRDRPGETIADASALASLLVRHDVDLYISGHHAAYYPGRLGDLELLFAGGIGARRLLGDEQPARSTVTLIDVWREPLRLVYTTFEAVSLTRLEPLDLPLELPSGLELSSRAGVTVAGPTEVVPPVRTP